MKEARTGANGSAGTVIAGWVWGEGWLEGKLGRRADQWSDGCGWGL